MSAPTPKKLLNVLRGNQEDVPPVWLMRQAGRYLPEYRELRAQKGGFLELAYDSDSAAEITLQPIRRFGFDGAILFSDILVIPHAMGQDLWFETGEGPRLAPRLAETHLGELTPVPVRLTPVFETVHKVRAGFARHNHLPRLCWKPLDGRYVHGARPREQGPVRSPSNGTRRACSALPD